MLFIKGREKRLCFGFSLVLSGGLGTHTKKKKLRQNEFAGVFFLYGGSSILSFLFRKSTVFLLSLPFVFCNGKVNKGTNFFFLQ